MVRAVGVWAFVALLSCGLSAQSRYEVDGSGSLSWYEFTGPPSTCFYPNGPVIFSATVPQALPCFPLNPFGPPPTFLEGDITDDMIKDLVYVTDGKSAAEYVASTGVQTNVMPLVPPGTGPVTGLGFDSLNTILWATDGSVIYGVTPTAPGSCAVPPLVFGPWPHTGFGPATDVTWFPQLGLLFAIDTLGGITGYTQTGAISIPTYATAGLCTLTAPFTGIAADTATGCGGTIPTFNVTDGTVIARIGLNTLAVPTTFYDTASCGVVPAAPTAGLAWAARPIKYGIGSGPKIGAIGQSCLPSPNFAITLSNAPPTGNAFLLVGTVTPCPPMTMVGQPLLVFPFTPFGPFPYTGGAFTLPAPLPAAGSSGAPPCGLSVYLQWFVKPTSGPWRSSDGLEMTFALP